MGQRIKTKSGMLLSASPLGNDTGIIVIPSRSYSEEKLGVSAT
jgi:hypothetical protein